MSESRREALAAVLLAGGAALLAVPARHLRVDVLTCDRWPPAGQVAPFALVYALALVALSIGWLLHPATNVTRTLGLAVIVHAIALVSPPSLSQDSLFYAAIGRSLAWFGGDGKTALDHALPANDAVLALLPPAQHAGQSPYFAGFNLLARGIARIAGDRVWLQLKLHQVTSSLALLTAGILGAFSVERRHRARALQLALLCPLGVVEATVEAHNDAFLAVATGLFALSLRGETGRAGASRSLASLASLASGLLVKANAALPLGVRVLELAWARLGLRLHPRALRAIAIAIVVALPLGLGLGLRLIDLNRFTALVGSPAAPFDYCTRSVECLPRTFVRWVLHAPTASWMLGLGFRALGLVWLGWCAIRAAQSGQSLRWMATALFIYYVVLHGWAQTWYLLPLLPLLVHADPLLQPAMLVYCVTGVAYYALYLPYACSFDHIIKPATEVVEAAVTIFPPMGVLLVTVLRRRRRDRDHAP